MSPKSRFFGPPVRISGQKEDFRNLYTRARDIEGIGPQGCLAPSAQRFRRPGGEQWSLLRAEILTTFGKTS